MNFGHPPTPLERFVIYLNDHRAMVVGEIALAERCRSSNVGTRLGHDLTDHIGKLATERDTLDSLINTCGGSADRWKAMGASIAEKLGRFKFNGQLVGYSPMSRVLELEGLVTGAAVRSLLWETCATVDHPTTDALDALIGDCRTSAADQQRTFDEHLVAARTEAFGSDSSDGTS